MTSPLVDYTVLDLTRARSGPTCVRQLADMGANVIQIESIEDPDQDFPRHGSDFQNIHRNKRSITLNLKHERGVAILKTRGLRGNRKSPSSDSRRPPALAASLRWPGPDKKRPRAGGGAERCAKLRSVAVGV